jgi:glycosyltransferase involved in cell wall biosynthesis
MDLCEIRVPTYRRPKLLKRALTSLLEQTYQDWRCIVLDDCRDASGRPIVEELRDPRIQYTQNPQRLGALGNIDQAFAPRPKLDGKYAFVLEDDNYLLPMHINTSIDILHKCEARVAFCNQYCETAERIDEPGVLTTSKTLDWMFRQGLHQPSDLLPALLFSHGFSNGAAFWRTECLSNFQIGTLTNHPGIQESLRLLRLKDPVYVSLEPTSVWRARDPQKSFAERKLSLNSLRRFALDAMEHFIVEIQTINYQSEVLRRLGPANVNRFITENAIEDFSRFRDERVSSIERAMVLCGYDERFGQTSTLNRIRWYLLGYLARHASFTIRARLGASDA